MALIGPGLFFVMSGLSIWTVFSSLDHLFFVTWGPWGPRVFGSLRPRSIYSFMRRSVGSCKFRWKEYHLD
jgi:hypothetical protein